MVEVINIMEVVPYEQVVDTERNSRLVLAIGNCVQCHGNSHQPSPIFRIIENIIGTKY